jgi:site-specific recombinase XerD
MKFVEPIRDMKKIAQIKNMLRWSWKIRDLLLFELWINSALRASDLLSTTIWDVFDEIWRPRKCFEIKESKTWKKTKVTLTPKVIDTLLLYKETYPNMIEKAWNALFFHSKKSQKGGEAIWRKQLWKMINKRCLDVWLQENYWAHTLRKTRWYHARKKWIPLSIIQHKLNHSSLRITMRYLGITYDEIEEACNSLDL